MRILVFGDSLADGLSIAGTTCDVASHWGLTTSALLESFPNLKYYLTAADADASSKKDGQFDVVILVAGSNDLANDALPKFAIDNLMRMHRQCRSAGVLVSVGVTLLHDRFNLEYKRRCRSARLPLCELLHEEIDSLLIHDDGIHLSDAGKKRLSHALLQTIRPPILRLLLTSFIPDCEALALEYCTND
jgi:lysophospholipase L1-like esterase